MTLSAAPRMTPDMRGDLTEMVDLLYKLRVIESFSKFSNALNHVMDLFDKHGYGP